MGNGFSARQYGIVGPHIIDVALIINDRSNPGSTRAIEFPLSVNTLDEEFERNGREGVMSFLKEIMARITEKAIDELTKEYQQ